MRAVLLAAAGVLAWTECAAGQAETVDVQERNKELARNFYQDLWLSNHTDKYVLYVADTYVVHDTGDRKNVTEPAIEQKNIADFFWENGEMTGAIDYQIAEGDMVATRWNVALVPNTFFGKYVLGEMTIPIINVFRYNEEGKIVEIWNHRHDIDTGQTNIFLFKGVAIGFVLGLIIPAIYAFSLRRRLKRPA